MGRLVRVVTRWGHMVARLRTSGEIARGSIFVPIHWSGSNASDARVGALVGPAVDPISGEPEFKNTPARVEPFVVNWYGFALTRGSLSIASLSWWASAEGGDYRRYEIAGRSVPHNGRHGRGPWCTPTSWPIGSTTKIPIQGPTGLRTSVTIASRHVCS